MKISTKRLTVCAVLAALTAVTTMAISIPSIATKGYTNLGDAMVMLSAYLLGPAAGALVGGLGSALADLLLGYVQYVPITFVVKGIEGLLAAMLFQVLRRKAPLSLVSGLVAGSWMAFGYFICECFMYGPAAALGDMPANLVQGIVGTVISSILWPVVARLGRRAIDSPES